MPLRYLLLPLLALALHGVATAQQQVLFAETFNGCQLPDGWTVEETGHPDAVWYVGQPNNANSDGSSIDGSCMLIFDDDATGDNTPAWTTTLVTPNIDISGWSTVWLSVDVHFRNYDGTDALELWVFDGQDYQMLRAYQNWASHTGEQFSQHVNFVADISLYATGQTNIMVRYRNGNTWTWWAGIDNLYVVGEGQATNIVAESFNDCSLPEGWATQIVTGSADWQFGMLNNSNASASSINGTCFAYFDDDGLGESAPFSTARLYTPVFDATAYAELEVSFDVVLRRYAALEGLKVGVYDEATGQHSTAVEYLADLGGPQMNNYMRETIDLSLFRSPSMRVFFEYGDGQVWGWWAGIDNVKVSGQGSLNDICSNAIDLALNAACTAGNNRYALYDGEQPDCQSGRNVGALWYRYAAVATGIVKVSTAANYNDVVTVFAGDCGQAAALHCTNRDEFGFTGETLYFNAVAGQTYLIRVSGQQGTFGRSRGELCIGLESADAFPPVPANDLCANALPLAIDGACVAGSNQNAGTQGPAPTRNLKSRADIWYTVVPQTNAAIEIQSGADFSDVITLFTGGCGNLTEVAANEFGRAMTLEQPVPGTTYHVQISSFFATLEGGVCVQARTVQQPVPANNLCSAALPVTVGGACVSASNANASWEGPAPSCDVPGTAAIWFSFTAPNSGSVKLNSRADFVHTLTIYSGTCNGLQEVFCRRNPLACEDYITVNGLLPGQSYRVRIGSSASLNGFAETGDVCLHIINGTAMPPSTALSLQVNVSCLGDGEQASLEIVASGGTGAYTLEGNSQGQVLGQGDTYLVVLRDEAGCEVSATGVVSCAQQGCSLALSVLSQEASCFGAADGVLTASVPGGGEGLTWQWSNGGTTPVLSNLSPGYYSLTATDGAGCFAITDVYLPEPPPLDIFVDEVVNASLGQANGLIRVSITGGRSPYTYEWRLNGSTVSTTEDPENLVAGQYSLVVTDANGCARTIDDIVVYAVTSTQDETLASYLQLYPNPTHEVARLSINLPGAQLLEVSLWDAAGRRLAAFPVQAVRETVLGIDMSDYPSGMYLVKVQMGSSVATKRLVKM